MNKIKVSTINVSNEHSAKYISALTKMTFSKKMNSSPNVAELLQNVNDEKDVLAKRVFQLGHLTLLEFIDVTVLVSGCSRSYTHQQVRNRAGFSFVQSSQHYIDHSDMLDYVVPYELLIAHDEKKIKKYLDTCDRAGAEYIRMIKEDGQLPEVARQVLPNATRCNLVIKANLRSWFNFLDKRLCFKNTTEINYIAFLIYKELLKVCPEVVSYFGPSCFRCGKCIEMDRTCGIKWSIDEMEKKYSKMF